MEGVPQVEVLESEVHEGTTRLSALPSHIPDQEPWVRYPGSGRWTEWGSVEVVGVEFSLQ